MNFYFVHPVDNFAHFDPGVRIRWIFLRAAGVWREDACDVLLEEFEQERAA